MYNVITEEEIISNLTELNMEKYDSRLHAEVRYEYTPLL
jgi:hypothetical protein